METSFLAFESQVRAEFPEFDIRKKSDSAFMRAIDTFMRVVSFGKATRFLDGFTTTIGTTVYVTSSWDTMHDVDKIILIRHERVHMRQARRYSRFWFSFLYLFVFFPIGLAYYRKKFEQEAYGETLRATKELKGSALLHTEAYKAYVVSAFTGPGYLYMWPFKKDIQDWYDGAVAEVEVKA